MLYASKIIDRHLDEQQLIEMAAFYSRLHFTLTLFQLNPTIWNDCLRGGASFAAQKNIVVGVVYAFAIAALIFLSGLIVEFVRSKLAKAIRIPVLSQKIVTLVRWVLQKVLLVLD